MMSIAYAFEASAKAALPACFNIYIGSIFPKFSPAERIRRFFPPPRGKTAFE